MSEAPLVRIHDVNKYYGQNHVLKNINLSVNKGEVIILLGPSGSGKSTLCRTINRLETTSSGTITIDGKDLPQEGRDLAKLRAEVGMVFQSFNLFAHKTILDNVTLGPRKIRKLPKAEAEAEAMKLLAKVGVESQAEKMPAQLSGGQQQRMAAGEEQAVGFGADGVGGRATHGPIVPHNLPASLIFYGFRFTANSYGHFYRMSWTTHLHNTVLSRPPL